MEQWHGKPYYSLDSFCKNTFGHKCYKVALNAHMTCPNRDGLLDTRGCIFCSAGGSGEFAVSLTENNISEQLQDGAARLRGKFSSGKNISGEDISACLNPSKAQDIIAYFQAYTNTYAPLPYLEQVYREALDHPAVCGISVATRPDCLPDDVLDLLARLQKAYPQKFIWVELGLQTIHDSTAAFIRRGYGLSCFEEAFNRLTAIRIPVIVHLILGLPGETEEMMLESVDYISLIHPFGVKLQLLHILEGTDLAEYYRTNPFPVMDRETYLSLLMDCLGHLAPDIVIHRLTGDGPRKLLIAPLWSTDKKNVLNMLHRMMREQGRFQGDRRN